MRFGGLSAPPFVEARVGPARVWCSGRPHGNVGDHVGDDPDVVARNRAALGASTSGAGAPAWVWLRQVHGNEVYVADAAPPPGREPAPVADAVVTATRGLTLAIVTADCAPLVIACDDAVGVVHAGHRGLANGVIEAAVARLRDIGTGDVRAFLGPCIRAPRYEFGADALAELVAQFGTMVEGRTRAGRPALDIAAAIGVVLERVGVVPFADCGICTADDGAYFSYRRDGETGRQATIAALP
ncbi:MAG: purine-nucleoside/S-methyl-5-thioadenosine phosphorylase / adenosine deaminase [Actinomycetota bacterium]|nr:purine-nucleoside/S-methyl-5-thioadenosine phosphorylase / adenosine deaminase [Actinomycetota bacterium]